MHYADALGICNYTTTFPVEKVDLIPRITSSHCAQIVMPLLMASMHTTIPICPRKQLASLSLNTLPTTMRPIGTLGRNNPPLGAFSVLAEKGRPAFPLRHWKNKVLAFGPLRPGVPLPPPVGSGGSLKWCARVKRSHVSSAAAGLKCGGKVRRLRRDGGARLRARNDQHHEDYPYGRAVAAGD